MTTWTIKSVTDDFDRALEIVHDQRNRGYTAWIEDENGQGVDEKSRKVENDRSIKSVLQEVLFNKRGDHRRHGENHQSDGNPDYHCVRRDLFRDSTRERPILRRCTVVRSGVGRHRQCRIVLLLSLSGGTRAERNCWKSRVLQFESVLVGFARGKERRTFTPSHAARSLILT